MIILKVIISLFLIGVLGYGIFDIKERKSIDLSDVLSIISLLIVALVVWTL